MSFISSASTYTIDAFLTQKGRELYFIGNDDDITTNFFSLGDSDTDYFISSNGQTNTNVNNVLKTGFIPNITGNDLGCIKTVANGVNFKYLIKVSKDKKGDIINQFCQPPYTLIQEISNGDGTSHFISTPNSISCGFVYKSNAISKSFTKTNCVAGAIGQSYTLNLPYGQFTATTQQSADQLALSYLNLSGQTIANQNGNCLYSNSYQTMSFIPNNCPHGGRPYVVSISANTFFSTISFQDANNQAFIYLVSNGQTIANQNGQCKVLQGYSNNNLINAVSTSTSVFGFLRNSVVGYTNDVTIKLNPDSSINTLTRINNPALGTSTGNFRITFELPIYLKNKNLDIEFDIQVANNHNTIETVINTQSGYDNGTNQFEILSDLQNYPSTNTVPLGTFQLIEKSQYVKQHDRVVGGQIVTDNLVFMFNNELNAAYPFSNHQYIMNLIITEKLPIYS